MTPGGNRELGITTGSLPGKLGRMANMTVPAKHQHGNISYVSAASITVLFLSHESH